jgi:chromosome segregation ATPase
MSDVSQRANPPTPEELHYREECDRLRSLLSKVEASGERDTYRLESENAALKERLATFTTATEQQIINPLKEMIERLKAALEKQGGQLAASKERVAQLERELAEVNALSRERLGPAGWKMVREVGELRKDRDALREVLDFYAQGNEWDYGVKAREALSPRSGDGAEESKT